MGSNAKFHLQFSRRHWETLGNNGDSFADTGYQATWEATRAQPGPAGVLVNYTGGTIAAHLHLQSPDELAAGFLAAVDPVLPGLADHCNGKTALDHWPTHPWTLGSYAFWKVGQYTTLAGAEGEREGNCLFAGEHTSIDFQGYLNGAVESGERAARDLLSDGKSSRR
jgi:monoamine oxidase